MATTFAAMRARLGDTEYYVLSMKAQDLVNRTKNGTALHDWTNLSVEERCRHEKSTTIASGRTSRRIWRRTTRGSSAPSSLPQDIFDRNVEFEPLRAGLVKGLPLGYRLETQDLGFLHFRGGELLVPLVAVLSREVAIVDACIDVKARRIRSGMDRDARTETVRLPNARPLRRNLAAG